MTKTLKESPRNDYLKEENLRVEASPLLVKAFPAVKSMTLDLGYHDLDRPNRSNQIKYTVKAPTSKTKGTIPIWLITQSMIASSGTPVGISIHQAASINTVTTPYSFPTYFKSLIGLSSAPLLHL